MNKFLFQAILSSMVLVSICSLAYGQNVPVMPDYSNWDQAGSGMYPAVHAGQQVTLRVDLYTNTDLVNLKRHSLVIVFNEKNNQWLALLTEETGEEHPDGSVTTKESQNYLFENKNNKFVFVKSFQDGPNLDEETAACLKSQYGLEFK